MDSEDWRVLAGFLRELREAKWSGLPPEAAAEQAWPLFRDAVILACREIGEAGLVMPDNLLDGRHRTDLEGPEAADYPPA